MVLAEQNTALALANQNVFGVGMASIPNQGKP